MQVEFVVGLCPCPFLSRFSIFPPSISLNLIWNPNTTVMSVSNGLVLTGLNNDDFNYLVYTQTQEHFQPRVHGFEIGMKLEVVHPIKPSIICPATVTKSLGPYYFAITTDYQEDVPSVMFCCHSDSPGIFPAGWCSRHQVELSVPASECK